MDLEEIYKFCKKTYKPGTYYNNAKEKYDNSLMLGYANYVSEVNPNRFHHSQYKNNQVAIQLGETGNGLVYYDGVFSDICDKDGNIIQVIDNPGKSELCKIREWLYKE